MKVSKVFDIFFIKSWEVFTMSTNLSLALFFVFLIVMLALIVFMFISLGKQGDERRKMIVEKASTKTFAITVGYLLFCIAENIFKVVSGKDLSIQNMNPFVTLTVIAMIYTLELFYHKKKYGD